ncbi:uncharacterized protein LOC108744105 [Agrilus planipennis]|uniref:Uncharacterized protein LOC108744105 n=1 Tax=Agrilus planipennis TaxID=224129 RepID=A0A1W4XGU4_AGRPL|nr:uncharacterized protein LOC108744105 [Agrilus planipennis]
MGSSTNSQSEPCSPNPDYSESEKRHNVYSFLNNRCLKTLPRNLEKGLFDLCNSSSKIEYSDFIEKSCDLKDTQTAPPNLNFGTFPRTSSTSPPKVDINYPYDDERGTIRSRSQGRNSQKTNSTRSKTDKKPIQLLVAHKIKPKISNSSVQGVNFNEDALSESSQNIVNSLDEEGILDNYSQMHNSDLNKTYSNFHEAQQLPIKKHSNYTRCNIIDDESEETSAIHKTRSLLREKFLKLLISLSGEAECKMQMFGGVQLYCNIKAFHPTFDTLLVDEIQPNYSKMFNNTIIRSSDILSIEFYNLNLHNLLADK